MNINLVCAINQLGYGIVSLNILKQLVLDKHNVSLFVLHQGEASVQDISLIESAQKRAKLYNPKAPSVRIWHAKDLAMHVGSGLHCGFPIFELDTFTVDELHQLKTMDVILTTSQWGENVLHNAGITHTRIVHLGVDRSIFHEKLPKNNNKTTRFMNCGKWEKRKGHDILVTAFNKAFDKDDDVKLIMHCWNPFLSPPMNSGKDSNRDWQLLYEKSKLGKEGKIGITVRCSNQYELARQISQVDCGVFPSRAEGWNLELLEFLSLGKHVIATNYSAHTEYINTANAYMIDIDDVELADDSIWFHGEGNWAKFGNRQMEQLIEHLRCIHRLKQSDILNRNGQGIMTAQGFSWHNTITQLVKGLS